MKTLKIKKGLMGEKNSVFVAFYTEAYHHYQTNEECRNWGDECWNTKVSLLGLIMRWDGSFGFVGGKVDGGENLIDAAIRETLEEVGTTINESQLTLLCSHEMIDGNFKQNTHMFVCTVTPDEIYEIQKNSQTSDHGKIESSGFNVVHMVKESFVNLPLLAWAGTGKQELNILIEDELIDHPLYEKNNK
jgi:8-oxo-dGTP pyrophosphatase MutT (NUDIX family)